MLLNWILVIENQYTARFSDRTGGPRCQPSQTLAPGFRGDFFFFKSKDYISSAAVWLAYIWKTSQELQMQSSVTLKSQVT